MATPKKTRSRNSATKMSGAPDTGKAAVAAPVTSPEAPPVTEAATPATDAQPADAMLVKKDLFQRVAAATGAKKKDVRLISEATLAIIGQALSEGEELNLPPLGKVRIVKSRDAGGAEVVTLKLRRRTAADGAAQGITPARPVAEDDAFFANDEES